MAFTSVCNINFESDNFSMKNYLPVIKVFHIGQYINPDFWYCILYL